MAKTKIIFFCPNCGSGNILARSMAKFNFKRQKWEHAQIDNLEENTDWCVDCSKFTTAQRAYVKGDKDEQDKTFC